MSHSSFKSNNITPEKYSGKKNGIIPVPLNALQLDLTL